jgi:hypothetical protein
MRAFVLTVPAQSTGRYKDVDWDAVLTEYRAGVPRHRKSAKDESAKGKTKSKSGNRKH